MSPITPRREPSSSETVEARMSLLDALLRRQARRSTLTHDGSALQGSPGEEHHMPHSPYNLTSDYELLGHGEYALEALRKLVAGNDTLSIAGFKLSLNEPARAIVSDEYTHYELEWDSSRWLYYDTGKPFKA